MLSRADFDSRLELFFKKLAARRQDGCLRRAIELFAGGEDLYEVIASGRDLVRHYASLVEALRREGAAPKTIAFYIGLINKVLRLAGVSYDMRLVRELVDIPKTRVIRSDRAPTKDELRRILMHASPRNRLLFMVMAVCGLRLSEALRLRVGDIIPGTVPPYLRVVSAKTGGVRMVPLTGEMLRMLMDYLGNDNDPQDLIFHARGDRRRMLKATDVQQYFYSTLRRAGLLKRDSSGRGYEIHIHSLRKFFKTELEAAGVNPLLIERWMGHNTGSVAQAYFRPSETMILEEYSKYEKALTIFTAPEAAIEKKISEIIKELDEIKRHLNFMGLG
jgi:integrase